MEANRSEIATREITMTEDIAKRKCLYPSIIVDMIPYELLLGMSPVIKLNHWLMTNEGEVEAAPSKRGV